MPCSLHSLQWVALPPGIPKEGIHFPHEHLRCLTSIKDPQPTDICESEKEANSCTEGTPVYCLSYDPLEEAPEELLDLLDIAGDSLEVSSDEQRDALDFARAAIHVFFPLPF